MPNATRSEFTEYCLRRLGKPMLKINVTPEQIEDRIDDAIQVWQEFHMDGYLETYVAHQLTQTDIDNKYVTIADDVMYITGMLPIHDKNSSISMFDIRYQLHLHDIFDLNFAGSLSNYVQTQQYIGLLDQILNGTEGIRYSRRGKRVYVDMDWEKIDVGEYIVFKAFLKVDPESSADAWNDKWLKAYSTALIKRQWGENLSKFDGVLMLGGVTMNGQQIFDAAMADIDTLEEELKTVYAEPVDFMIG